METVVQNLLPLTAMLRVMDAEAGATNLMGGEGDPTLAPVQNLSSAKVPHFKKKIDIRPVWDMSVHSPQSISQGPFRKLRGFPDLGFYQPFLYVSDFWLLEKDYTQLNDTLLNEPLNLTLDFSVVSTWSWSLQSQMSEQWMVQGEWGMTDTQRDSFMLKRLFIDTNTYLLAFSGCFILCHTLFSMLAFKNDIQFWRKNESMKGLSARSMGVSWACQLITCLYLLNSKETSRLILFEIVLDMGLATWKIRKAMNLKFVLRPPFIEFTGKAGYDSAGTAKHDEVAFKYMVSMLLPMYFGYCVRSLLYGKHRNWWTFVIGSLAGGVYTFGFIMMTPQLYINYKMQSVEHLPWRALTYKAMNTFVDDIAALLIDMPMMHRLSCFRDDIIFFIYIYQRWAYRVDKSRPTMWTKPDAAVTDAGGGTSGVLTDDAAAQGARTEEPGAAVAADTPDASPVVDAAAHGSASGVDE